MGIFPQLETKKSGWRQKYLPKQRNEDGEKIDPHPRPCLGIDFCPIPAGGGDFSPMRGGIPRPIAIPN